MVKITLLIVPFLLICASIYTIIKPLKCNDALFIKTFHKNDEVKIYTHRTQGIILLVLSLGYLGLSIYFFYKVNNGQMSIGVASFYSFIVILGMVIVSTLLTYLFYLNKFKTK